MIDGGLLFSYPGSKWRLARRFQQCYPPHRTYVDVFGGSAALIARQRPRAVEVYNDLDPTVSNVFATVKDAVGCEQILRLLKVTSNDSQQYKACKRILANPGECNVRRAWAFLVCGSIGFAAHPALANGWIPHERQRRDFLNLPAKLRWWYGRLRNVQVENRPWQEIVERYDSPDTFFACDPPYLAGVLRSCAGEYYQYRMDARAHIELIERLRKIRGYPSGADYDAQRKDDVSSFTNGLTLGDDMP